MNKITALIITLVTINFSKAQIKQYVPSNTKSIKIVVNGDTNSWGLSPDARPDILEVECTKPKNKVIFITDVVTKSFVISEGKIINFVILYQGKDSCFTQIKGIAKNANFSAAYIKAHKGKLEVEVPEVHELLNVLSAMSLVGQRDSNMTDMTTDYHKEVLTYFKPFMNEPIMTEVNKNMTASDEKSYWYYYAMKMNACAYTFTPINKIVNKGIIRHMGFTNPPDPIPGLARQLEAFSEKTKFRTFYKNHLPYYNSLIATYRSLNPIDEMQKWLEKKFGFAYGNYSVYFSPLVNGAHATTRFSDNGFEQTAMFICGAFPDPKMNAVQNEMWNSKVVFTEIDHNFVNPISDKNVAKINQAMSNRHIWVNESDSFGTSAYSNPYTVFNEYMTFGVYSLYCLDRFPAAETETFFKGYEKKMGVEGRGFIKFDLFNQELVRVYKGNPSLSVQGLYDKMFTWCETINNK
jgi:Domain of unknown function (DUF4932)